MFGAKAKRNLYPTLERIKTNLISNQIILLWKK